MNATSARSLGLAGLLLFPAALSAQYSIDWYTIDGGGGISTGGVYSITGTIGQPDAGTMSGGTYTLQGGFWGIIAAVQTPGAPLLSIVQANNIVKVFWSTPADGFVLVRTATLNGSPIPWGSVSSPYQTNGSEISVRFTNLPPIGNAFFRLQK